MTDHLNPEISKRTHLLRVIGQFVAKAMLDSRIIDLTFNKVFLKLVLGEEVPLTIASLKVCAYSFNSTISWSQFNIPSFQLVDIDLANSLEKLRSIASSKLQPQNNRVCWNISKSVNFPWCFEIAITKSCKGWISLNRRSCAWLYPPWIWYRTQGQTRSGVIAALSNLTV